MTMFQEPMRLKLGQKPLYMPPMPSSRAILQQQQKRQQRSTRSSNTQSRMRAVARRQAASTNSRDSVQQVLVLASAVGQHLLIHDARLDDVGRAAAHCRSDEAAA